MTQRKDQSRKGDSGEPETGQNADLKAQMREALERKKAKSHPTEHALDVDPAQRMHGAEAHVDTQTYRRKAGGGGS